MLIDFDCAVHVDRGRTITGFRGTKPWAAPEVGRKNEEYDPFLADRYSCGVVFNMLWLCVRPSAPDLHAFSVALTSENPTDRPPLQTWIQRNVVQTPPPSPDFGPSGPGWVGSMDVTLSSMRAQ
ncbi:hypothetical protein BT96DRAFT_373436 [Gymnopus androsaceus JB14]|uniref:Protein kinase domain-containing protein n=1 Tax=Gymnopus androsaceus JB14 TaxID=1447944 RepID=A0A6A4INR4_9AGAR|nr:hypothetical protein BT96DRAFT_373436 [Gymnopus androsaceus JB14]